MLEKKPPSSKRSSYDAGCVISLQPLRQPSSDFYRSIANLSANLSEVFRRRKLFGACLFSKIGRAKENLH
jgi:hypothetical protein